VHEDSAQAEILEHQVLWQMFRPVPEKRPNAEQAEVTGNRPGPIRREKND
jgi:hypothetical protein